jgi:siroheme synthase
VSVEVVPGVTSAFSVPAAAGIPITHRGTSRQVTVLSGHDALDNRDDPVYWRGLAAAGGTLVVLMGVAALPSITAGLLAGGMDPRTPVAVIENGWTVDQRVTVGTIADIAGRAEEVGASSPAVIAIGDVVALAP